MIAIDAKWKAHETVAQSAKRCPGCGKMVQAGETCVARDARHQATSGKTPWIGNRQSYTRGAWHLYHPSCWVQFVECVEASSARAESERETRFAEMRAAIGGVA